MLSAQRKHQRPEDKFLMSKMAVGSAMVFMETESLKPERDEYAIDHQALLLALHRRKAYVALVADKPDHETVESFLNFQKMLEYACGASTAEDKKDIDATFMDDYDVVVMMARCRSVQAVRVTQFYKDRFHPNPERWDCEDLEKICSARVESLKQADFALTESSSVFELEEYWMLRTEFCELVIIRVVKPTDPQPNWCSMLFQHHTAAAAI